MTHTTTHVSCILIHRQDGQWLAVSDPLRPLLWLPFKPRRIDETAKHNAIRAAAEETGLILDSYDVHRLCSGTLDKEPRAKATLPFDLEEGQDVTVDCFYTTWNSLSGYPHVQHSDYWMTWVKPQELLRVTPYPKLYQFILEAFEARKPSP